MKRFIASLVAVISLIGFASTVSADEGEVMGGSHLPPVRTYSKPKVEEKPLYAEDNQAMGNTHDPILSTYKRQYPYHYDYYQNPIYYGYYDDYGYWYNYTDDWGYPMYWYNGGFYYY